MCIEHTYIVRKYNIYVHGAYESGTLANRWSLDGGGGGVIVYKIGYGGAAGV